MDEMWLGETFITKCWSALIFELFPTLDTAPFSLTRPRISVSFPAFLIKLENVSPIALLPSGTTSSNKKLSRSIRLFVFASFLFATSLLLINPIKIMLKKLTSKPT